MEFTSRRNILKAALIGAGSTQIPGAAHAKSKPHHANLAPKHAAGIEGQRKADLGNGTFLNPIVPGDHPDPTVLKDGDDYYMTFSSFFSYPGVVIWHSRDLVNWTPIGPALTKPIGSVWAMDLVKHNGRYFIYIPATPGGQQGIFVIHADDIRGPWSDPIDLKIPNCIDPGHAVGEDGKRYLFVGGISRIGLTDDGLATVGALEHVYSPWHYPDGLGRRDVRARGPEDLPARRLVLSHFRRRRHIGSADKPYGRRRTLAFDQRTLGELPAQSDRPYHEQRRALVVARPCIAGRGTGRRLVDDLSRLRKRLSHAGPPDAAGADRMDA